MSDVTDNKPAAPALPSGREVLQRLLAAKPDIHENDRAHNLRVERRASRITRAMIEETFAATFVASGFSAQKAYQAVRPGTPDHDARSKGAKMLAHRNGRVAALINAAQAKMARKSAEELELVLAQLKADAEANIFDYIERANIPVVVSGKDGPTVEYVEGYRFNLDPERYNKLQQRGVTAVTIKNGEVTQVKMVDRQRAQENMITIAKLLSDGDKKIERGTGVKLRAAIDRAKRLQVGLAKKLPLPKNVSELRIVDGVVHVPPNRDAGKKTHG